MNSYNVSKLLFFSILLCGCGQTGPLYLPGTPPPIHVEKEKTAPPVEAEKAAPKTTNSQQKQ
jgi:hypothetical protein